MLGLLAALGAGFDCASEAEVDAVMALGVPANRIVFANACKRASDIRYVGRSVWDFGVTVIWVEPETRQNTILCPCLSLLFVPPIVDATFAFEAECRSRCLTLALNCLAQ